MGDPDELRVIHALRLKGFADTAVIAEAAEVDPTVAGEVLEAAAAQGQVRHREGRMTGWMLLPPGRARGEALLAADLDAHGKRPALETLYQRFLVHNQPFLRLCTEWQVRHIDGAPAVNDDGQHIINDHSDEDYDAAVVAKLEATDREMQPICTDLANLLPRFATYGPRFATALGKLRAGDLDWFTKPVIESYHTVWFELHEDLLASLGIERAQEGQQL